MTNKTFFKCCLFIVLSFATVIVCSCSKEDNNGNENEQTNNGNPYNGNSDNVGVVINGVKMGDLQCKCFRYFRC